MGKFVPCVGKAYCREGSYGCRTCGRSNREIEHTRALIDQVARFALEQGYDNPDDFATYLAEKVKKKVQYVLDNRRSAVAN